MHTKWKVLALFAVSAGFVGFAACGGGGGGGDGNGNSVTFGGGCFQQPTTCANGQAATKSEDKNCPYYCAQAGGSVNTGSYTGTGTATN